MKTTTKTTKAWIVMSIPGDDREPTSWYVYNRETLEQHRCDSLDEARDAVHALNSK